MEADLAAIDAWLERHAPATHRLLRPGLDRAGLAALESAYGFPLHPQLRTLLAWHDGSEPHSSAMPIWTDFVFEASAPMFDRRTDYWEEFDEPGWEPVWVPFATDLGLNTLVVDHGTAPGRVMLVDGVNGFSEEFSQTWPSLAALAGRLYAAMDAGALEDRTAVVEDGFLRWAGD